MLRALTDIFLKNKEKIDFLCPTGAAAILQKDS
jgi:hypothetical protein